MEIRTTNQAKANVRIATREDGKRYVEGYAAVYYRDGESDTEYQIFSDLFERIIPGAFDDAIKEDDVRALLNHDANMLLARTGNDLKLSVDDVGLRYEFPIDEKDPDHLRVVAKLERGDLTGSSFGFTVQKRMFVEYEDYDVVELHKVRLYDVSPATFPAYAGTSVGLRSDESGDNDLLKARKEWKEQKQKERNDIDSRMKKAQAGIL